MFLKNTVIQIPLTLPDITWLVFHFIPQPWTSMLIDFMPWGFYVFPTLQCITVYLPCWYEQTYSHINN